MSDAISFNSAAGRLWLIVDVAPQGVGEASATITVGHQLGASVGTALLSIIFASAVTSYLTAYVAAARIIGRHALTRLALAHGYDTVFCWTGGIFIGGTAIGGTPAPPPAATPKACAVAGT